MKYIKTKDGRIIDLKNWSSVETICVNAETDEVKKDICYQRVWFEQNGDTCKYETEFISHNSQVLSQADTIEELCDEFIVVSRANVLKPWKITRKWLETLKQAQKYEPSDKCSIYGAIWTDKGLSYVAKMNENGVLELI